MSDALTSLERLLLVLILAAFVAPLAMPLLASGGAITDADARRAVGDFLAALDALDADAFVAAFSDDATLFYPQPGMLKRIEGHAEIRRTIEIEFAKARERLATVGITEPPFLRIVPLEMKVQLLDDATAVVTWHVDRKTHGGRRTAVVHGTLHGWKIVSLHSSNMGYG